MPQSLQRRGHLKWALIDKEEFSGQVTQRVGRPFQQREPHGSGEAMIAAGMQGHGCGWKAGPDLEELVGFLLKGDLPGPGQLGASLHRGVPREAPGLWH